MDINLSFRTYLKRISLLGSRFWEIQHFEPKARFKSYFLRNWGVSLILLDPEPFFISNNKLFKMLSSGISLKTMFFHLILIVFLPFNAKRHKI